MLQCYVCYPILEYSTTKNVIVKKSIKGGRSRHTSLAIRTYVPPPHLMTSPGNASQSCLPLPASS